MWATCSPKQFFDLFGSDIGVLDGVMEQAGGDGGGVHLEFGEDEADFEGMDGVWLSGGALLAFMLLQAEGPGFADDFQVVAGPIVVGFVQEVSELGVDLVDYRSAGAGEMACRTVLGGGVVWLFDG